MEPARKTADAGSSGRCPSSKTSVGLKIRYRMRWMRRFYALSAIFALVFVVAQSAQGESWFHANPEYVKQYSKELADKARTPEERLEALRGLRILFTTYGASNCESALPVLKTVRREAGQVRAPATALFDDLQTALKRPDKQLPHRRAVFQVPSSSTVDTVASWLSDYKIGVVH
jgi:hypothetical protein